MLLFYDWEVFKYDNLCVVINPQTKQTHVFENDLDGYKAFWEEHQDHIWCGYNSRGYDQWISRAAIVGGFDLKELNDFIIVGRNKGFQFSNALMKVPFVNYDCMPQPPIGLKTLEAMQGHDIRETNVPFAIQRKLTPEEMADTIRYCTNDVEETMNVFCEKKADFTAILQLVKLYNLPLSDVGKTKAQLAAKILQARQVKRNDEFEFDIPDTLEIVRYSDVVEWYRNSDNHDYSKKLTRTVAGVEHVFGYGGIHGSVTKSHIKGKLLNVDVGSMYPSIAIRYGYLSRNVPDPKAYEEIRELRFKYKREGNPLEYPLKILLNATYGASKDKYNKLYDPRQANSICVGGQLLLLDLLEHLEGHCRIIMSNTDGILMELADCGQSRIKDICKEWEQRTGLNLDYDEYSEIWIKDVNNYIIRTSNGKVKTKGSYVKKLGALDYDLPIVNEAVRNYLMTGRYVRDTVYSCTDLIKFQKIVKLSSKYERAFHNYRFLTDKTFRVFASVNENDTPIGKKKAGRDVIEKFANTPSRCFIDNSDITKKRLPRKLDREWYVDLALKRLEGFGVPRIRSDTR